MRVLITGGAGFIGSHLSDLLISQGHEVIILDNLDTQVHGPGGAWPAYLPPRQGLRRILGDVRGKSTLREGLLGEEGVLVDAVVHLAAKVGVGQGQYQIADYYSVNVTGTALLLQEMATLAAQTGRPIPRLFVAGSMSSYGEGLYRGPAGDKVRPGLRPTRALSEKDWRARLPAGMHLGDGDALPIPETEALQPASFYASTKAEQERMALIFGQTYSTPVWVGRFFNTYGTRQALGNPYTGVVAIFANQIKAGEQPTVYEDGRQTRDFINVLDVARAVSTLIQADPSTAGVYNVGTGKATSILEVAQAIGRTLGVPVSPKVTGKFRSGDIRHCFADSSKLRALGWAPQVSLRDGLEVLFDWLAKQPTRAGLQEKAHQEMAARGLIS